MFFEFLQQGFFHILDIGALDHLLFLLVLGIVYDLSQWKKLLWVLTAFTIAHSLSLALSILNIININAKLVEVLIPLTILITCIENFIYLTPKKYNIILAGIFGLIHGLGFSNTLKELFIGMDINLFQTLLPFNIGIELAQILFMSILIFLLHYFNKLKLIAYCNLVRIISAFVAVQSMVWIVTRFNNI